MTGRSVHISRIIFFISVKIWVVFYPLRSRITTSKAPVVIGSIWVAAAALSSVQLAVGRSTSYVIVDELQVRRLDTVHLAMLRP